MAINREATCFFMNPLQELDVPDYHHSFALPDFGSAVRCPGDFYFEPDRVTRGFTLAAALPNDVFDELGCSDPNYRGMRGCYFDDKEATTGYTPALPSELPLCSLSPTCIVVEAGSASNLFDDMERLLQQRCGTEILKARPSKFSITASVCQTVCGYDLQCRVKAKVYVVTDASERRTLGKQGLPLFAVQISRRSGDAIAFGEFLASARRHLLGEEEVNSVPAPIDKAMKIPINDDASTLLQPLFDMLMHGPNVSEALVTLAFLSASSLAVSAAYQDWMKSNREEVPSPIKQLASTLSGLKGVQHVLPDAGLVV